MAGEKSAEAVVGRFFFDRRAEFFKQGVLVFFFRVVEQQTSGSRSEDDNYQP